MPEIELKPSEVRERYDVPIMPKRWLIVPSLAVALAAYVNGFDKVETWALIFVGMLLMIALVSVFPRFFLRRDR